MSELTKEMKFFEASMRLKDLKEGDVVTWQNMEAINYLLGDILEKCRSLKPSLIGELKFTSNGEPYTTDGNPLGLSVNGKSPLDLSENKP